MPIINLIFRGDMTKCRFKLDRNYKWKSAKILHAYHNLRSSHLSTKETRSNGEIDTNINLHPRLIFIKLNIFNADNVSTYEVEDINNAGLQDNPSSNAICIGMTNDKVEGAKMKFKDLYKAIISDIPKEINQQISMDMYFCNSGGHLVRAVNSDFNALGQKEASILMLTIEYSEY